MPASVWSEIDADRISRLVWIGYTAIFFVGSLPTDSLTPVDKLRKSVRIRFVQIEQDEAPLNASLVVI